MFPIKHPFKRSGQRILIPKEFEQIILEFVLKYLKDKPKDLIEYALEYFYDKRKERSRQLLSVEEEEEPVPVYEPAVGDPDYIPPPPRVRRRTVFAEAYDPEADEGDDDVKITYPKSDEQRVLLGEVIKDILLFRAIDKEQQIDILDAMFERNVVAGEQVIRQGDDGDNFYIIENGTYEASILIDNVDTVVKTYNGQGSFGELALLYNMPRAATVTAITEGLLWAMDRTTFRRIVLKAAFRKRKMYEGLLNSVPMLSTLQSYERMSLADALVSKIYQEGECIIKEGDAADGMYFVEYGIVRITITSEFGEQVEVNRVGKGGYFGELALVTHRPRAASVCAMQEVKVAFLDVAAFERLLGPCMDVMKRNVDLYHQQMLRIFGSLTTIQDE